MRNLKGSHRSPQHVANRALVDLPGATGAKETLVKYDAGAAAITVDPWHLRAGDFSGYFAGTAAEHPGRLDRDVNFDPNLRLRVFSLRNGVFTVLASKP